jgi:hypothetical protein
MKTLQNLLTLLFILFSISTVSAQYGNGGYGGNSYGNGYGSGSGRMSQMGGMNQQSQPEKPKEIPIEVTVGKIIERMKPEINLDELQVIAISNVLAESIRSQGILMKQVTNQEDQIKDFKALSEVTDRKINDFLNEDQKPKYLAFKEGLKTQKKSKSDKKKK